MKRALVLLLALLGAPSARAQPPFGACAVSTWTCIAACIDRTCAQRCAAPCASAIAGLRRCLKAARCAAGDGACQRKACPQQCEGVFGALGPAAPAAPAGPCVPPLRSDHELPSDWVGQWELAGAGFVRDAPEEEQQSVRADYGLRLHLSAPGCFEMETRLKEATLGEGNSLTLRVWGQVVMVGEQEWLARAAGGSLSGEACGQPRTQPLPGLAGRTVTQVSCRLDHGSLSLMPVHLQARELLFERVKR